MGELYQMMEKVPQYCDAIQAVANDMILDLPLPGATLKNQPARIGYQPRPADHHNVKREVEYDNDVVKALKYITGAQWASGGWRSQHQNKPYRLFSIQYPALDDVRALYNRNVGSFNVGKNDRTSAAKMVQKALYVVQWQKKYSADEIEAPPFQTREDTRPTDLPAMLTLQNQGLPDFGSHERKVWKTIYDYDPADAPDGEKGGKMVQTLRTTLNDCHLERIRKLTELEFELTELLRVEYGYKPGELTHYG